MKITPLLSLYTLEDLHIKYFFRIMKISTILLFVFVFQLFATNSNAQSSVINISNKNLSIGELFEEIESQTDYLVVYSKQDVDINKEISVSNKKGKVEDYLSEAFDQSDLEVDFDNNYIVLAKKPNESIMISDKAEMSTSKAKKIQITGTVLDETGIPIPSVTVMIVGTTTGCVTSIDGEYTINVSQGEKLRFSFIGYRTEEVTVGTNKLLNIQMKEYFELLDEVVVVGFGSIKKSSLTGSISVVKAEQLAERPVANMGQALQGVVPGLNLTVDGEGGELNNAMNINIRGAGTIGEGSSGSPLVLIDGMEGDMNTLNMQDVESISVMKDAASATIYGSRAPFGVILITTKKGSQGKPVINYNNNLRFSMPNMPDPLNSWDFANYYNDGAKNVGIADPYDANELKMIQQYRNGEIDYNTKDDGSGVYFLGSYNSWADENWFDVFYRPVVFSQEHNMSVSGGSEKIQYYLSASYMDQGGALNYAQDTYDRLSFTSKINAEITSWLKVGATTRFTRTEYDAPRAMESVMYHNVFRHYPTTPSSFPTDPDSPLQYENYGDWSMMGQIRYGGRQNDEDDTLVQQFNLTIEPLEGWDIIAEFNYRVNTNNSSSQFINTQIQTPTGEIMPDGYSTGSDWVQAWSSKTNFMSPSIYTNYDKRWDSGHSFKGTLGFQSELNNYRNMKSYGYNLISTDLPTLDNTTTEPYMGGSFSGWATAGFFGRLNYDYKEKYLLEVSARYDGTSRFLEDQRWNLFPSVSAGWNMKKEAFLENVDLLSTLKVRGSWGQLGNQNTTSLYPFYQMLEVDKEYSWLLNGEKAPIYTEAPGLISSLLTWETVESWNVGVDFGFLDYRLAGAIDVFNRKTLNMVGPAPILPPVLGTDPPLINNTDQESKGWELELSWRDEIESIGLNYGIRGTLSDSRRFVTKYPNETKLISEWYDGQEAGLIWGYTTIGIAQSQAEMDTHLAKVDQSALGAGWGAGDIMYADLNGDGKVNAGEGTLANTGDKTVIGNSQSRYNYGITLDAAWKGLDFSMFLQGVGKRDLWLDGFVMWGMQGGTGVGLEQHLDYWRPEDTQSVFGPNTDAYYAKPELWDGDDRNQWTQTRYLQNGAYMRIKNIQLGYTLPARISSKIELTKLRVFFSADNVATFSKMNDIFDPESTGGGWGAGKTYPLSQVISFGLNITL